jgi:hypothetical protein
VEKAISLLFALGYKADESIHGKFQQAVDRKLF